MNENWEKETAKYRDLDRNIDKNPDCTEADKRIIREYIADKKRVDHIADNGAVNTVSYLLMIKRFMRTPYEDASINDILDGIEALRHGKTKPQSNRPAKPYSPSTIKEAVIVLKAFLYWLVDEDADPQHKHHSSITESRIRKKIITPKGKDATEVIRKEDVLREEEILKMVRTADCQRSRAMVFLTYESGARIGEIGSLRWRDLIFERVGEEGKEVDTAKLNVTDHKSGGKKRYVRLTMSVIDLIAHKNLIKPREEDYIFLTDGLHENTTGEPLSKVQYAHVFKNIAKKAGITKPVNPHAFRHARATELIRQGFDETTIKQMLWNNLDTKMFKVYVAICDDDIDREVFKRTGIKTMLTNRNERLQVERTPRPCPVCHTQNPFDAQVCKCGAPVSPEGIKAALEDKKRRQAEEEAYQKQSIIKLLEDPAVVSILKHKVNDTVIPVGIVDGDKLPPGTPRYRTDDLAFNSKEEADKHLRENCSDDGKVYPITEGPFAGYGSYAIKTRPKKKNPQ